MSSHGLLNDLILIPIPITIVTAAGFMRHVAISGTSLDPRPSWRKWLACAAIIWAAGMACGLYIDISTALRYGWPQDWISGFTGTFLGLAAAAVAMPIMFILWGLSRLLKTLFPSLRLGGSDDDWDMTAGL